MIVSYWDESENLEVFGICYEVKDKYEYWCNAWSDNGWIEDNSFCSDLSDNWQGISAPNELTRWE